MLNVSIAAIPAKRETRSNQNCRREYPNVTRCGNTLNRANKLVIDNSQYRDFAVAPYSLGTHSRRKWNARQSSETGQEFDCRIYIQSFVEVRGTDFLDCYYDAAIA